jgi:hypothetical protein
MPAGTEVVGLTHKPVGSPCHNMGLSESNLDPTPRARIGLRGRGDRLHSPLTSALYFDAPGARKHPRDIKFFDRLPGTSTRTV